MMPDFKASVLFTENYNAHTHIVINQGGTSSGKTFSIMLVLFCIACENAGQVITIVGQDIPNLKAGALRDALKIYADYTQVAACIRSYNRSERVFEFSNGTIMEFKSYDDAQDAKSGKRDYLFINEANGIDWQIYTELALRTRIRIYIDYNPNSAFWVHDNLIGSNGVQLIISDHRHNPFLADDMRLKIESLKTIDTEQWKVYARGVTGKITGLVLNNWHLCDSIPQGAKLLGLGLDFGFTNDETGCIEVYKQNGELWINELIYETGLTNLDISERLSSLGIHKNTELIADSAEPKSIEEVRRLGWRIKGVKKGADSIKNSIDILKRYPLNITRNSVNLRNELSRYKWRIDRSGRTLNEPIDRWNHLIDPLRYVALNKLKINNLAKPKSWFPYKADQFQAPLSTLINI
ncbi:MAG: terminase large subunit [Mucilaginibacter sp.]